MRPFLKQNQLKLLGVSITALTFLIFVFYINDSFFGSDYSDYDQGANSIINYSTYSTQGDINVPDNFRPPGYSIVLAFFKIISADYFSQIIVLLQGVMFIVSYFVALKILKTLGILTNVSLVITTLVFNHPVIVYTATQLQSDFMLFFSIILFLYFFTLSFKSSQKRKMILYSIFFLCISIYFRPTYLYFLPLYLIFIFKLTNFKTVFYSIGALLLIVSPWIVRNKIVLDTTSFSKLGKVVLTYYAAETIRFKENVSSEKAMSIVEDYSGYKTPHYDFKTDKDNYSNMVECSTEIILNNFTSFIYASMRGFSRVFIMPHNIFKVKNASTWNVHEFITIIKSNPTRLFSKFNLLFVYLYIYPYIINIFFFCSLILFVFSFKNYLGKDKNIYFLLISFIMYSLLVPGPINRIQYILPYFFMLTLLGIRYIENGLIYENRRE